MNTPSKYQTRSLKASYQAGYRAGYQGLVNRVDLRGPDNKEAYRDGFNAGQKDAARPKKVAA